MRRFAFASMIVAAGILGACSAVDDFTKFTFADGGSVNTDMGGGNLPGFGQSCVDACDPGPGAAVGQPLTCMHTFGSKTVPGGMCTRTCTVGTGTNIGCSDLGTDAADCVVVEGMAVCLPRCNPMIGRNCRTNYSCCANHNVVTDAGDCAPSTTDLCH